MTINKLVAGAKGAVGNSTGADVAAAVNGLIDRAGENPNKALRPFGRVEASAGVLGYTMHITLLSKVPFFGARFKFVNAATVAIASCKAAFSTPSDNLTPCITTAPWTNITVDGSTSFTQSASVANTFVITDSDVMQVKPVARTDGEGYLLMVRLFVPSAGNTTTNRVAGANDIGDPSASINAQMFQGGAWAGDAIAAPSSFVRTISTLAAPIFVELLTGEKETPVLMYVGDSVTQGQAGAGESNFNNGAAKQAALQLGMIPYCGASAGAKSVDYLPFNIAQLQIVQPKFAAAAPWSTNDTDAYTDGVEGRINLNMAQWISACYSVRAIPALITPAPRNGITLAQETVRRSVVAAVKEFCSANNVILIDRDLVYTDYDSPTGGYKSGLNADTIHPNYAGYAAETPTWVAALSAS